MITCHIRNIYNTTNNSIEYQWLIIIRYGLQSYVIVSHKIWYWTKIILCIHAHSICRWKTSKEFPSLFVFENYDTGNLDSHHLSVIFRCVRLSRSTMYSVFCVARNSPNRCSHAWLHSPRKQPPMCTCITSPAFSCKRWAVPASDWLCIHYYLLVRTFR